MTRMLTLIAGAGYTGRRVAERLGAEGLANVSLVSSEEKAEQFNAAGLSAFALNLDDDQAGLPILPESRLRILYLIPPADGEGDPRLRRFLDLLTVRPVRFVLASTSGVYGDRQGAVVDERTPAAPATERAKRRVQAETTTRRWCEQHEVDWAILRIAGIYGPGRLPLAAIRDGSSVIREEDSGPGNRIHVEDLVTVCLAALAEEAPTGIFNVADESHESSGEFYRRIARAAGLPAPPEVSRSEARRSISALRYSFLAESRRLATTRLRRELGVSLAYDDVDAGIRASLRQEDR